MKNIYLPIDPRGLIHEAYQMDIGPQEARSIFLDWALRDLVDEPLSVIPKVLAHYETDHPDHPMTAVLREGLSARTSARQGRRQRRGRRKDS